ncbi:MAG: ABC transporter ATP-binding protein [Gammaproteobacteria bacterium]|nr:MAG: ABC transporter ATP-binding protein [Gammaproteobacteria bacterium]
MNKVKIHVSNVGKSYYKFRSEFHRFLSWFGVKCSSTEQTDVLRNINFSVREGEAVALVGENGAGKSTLLKMITGTVQSSYGAIAVTGRVSALLELGLGLNPEMTGRHNVYLMAGVMGYKEQEIGQLVDGIFNFSELGDYFDQPVRTYSSGMQMRLAFSVATAERPDVLIIDEALSVGDTYFQHKSFNRIKAFREQGTTLLFVSHDRGAVQTLCDRAILLEKGAVIKDGKPEEVMDFYNALIAEKENNATIKQDKLADGRVKTISGTGEASVVDVAILDNKGQRLEFVDVGQPVTLALEVEVYRFIPCLVLGYGIRDRLGQVIYGTNTYLKKQPLENVEAGARVRYEFDFSANLGPGSYSLQTALVSNDTHLENNYEWRDLALIFNVVNINKPHFDGCSWIDPTIRINQL